VGPEADLELLGGPAQHLLVLDLLLREAQQRPQPGLVAVHVGAGTIDHQRNDVLLDERKDVAVIAGRCGRGSVMARNAHAAASTRAVFGIAGAVRQR